MNLEKLYIDQEIKNYNVLCELLDLETKKGNSRLSQIKDIEQFVRFEKLGHKYIVKEIYEVPMKREDNRSIGSKSIYIKYIEAILLRLLSEQVDHKTLVIAKNELFHELGMVSKKYIEKDKDMRKILVDTLQFKQQEIDDFDLRSYKVLNRILISSLNNLQNRCLLNWWEVFYISEKNSNGSGFIVRPANDDEIARYTDLKRQVLEEMSIFDALKNDCEVIYKNNDDPEDYIIVDKDGNVVPDKYDGIQDVFLRNQMNNFYSTLNKKIKSEYNWEAVYKKYKIVYTKKNVTKAIAKTDYQLKKLEEKDDSLSDKKILNDKIIQALNNNAISTYKKSEERFWNEYDEMCELSGYGSNASKHNLPIPLIYVKTVPLSSDYLDIQSKLADKLVKI